jgi:hypothetical protein
MAERTALLQY